MEKTILRSLLWEEGYVRKAIPFLKDEYFSDDKYRAIFTKTRELFTKYGTLPTAESVFILIKNDSKLKLNDEAVKEIGQMLSGMSKKPEKSNDEGWLVDQTEKFCQERAIYNAIMESIQIIDAGSKSTKGKGAIPQLLSDALAVSFDTNIGHDYLNDSDARYDYYHKVEDRLPFDIDWLNLITKGGLPRKTINVLMAGTGVGKTMSMCHFAAHNLAGGHDVLYITMEMSAEEISKRIDANLLNVSLDDLMDISKPEYDKRISRLKAKTNGRLIVKEYSTGGPDVNHFKSLLNELWIKKKFRPRIIYIDYLNICASARIKLGSNVNTYTYIKYITEELRGLAQEFNVPLFTATQTNREGSVSSDVDMTDTSESFGLPMTADFMIAGMINEQLAALNQMSAKQLKNRYGDKNKNTRAIIGVDSGKQRLYNVEQAAQTISGKNTPPMQGTTPRPGLAPGKGNKFSNLKVT